MQPLNKKCHLHIEAVIVIWREMTSCFRFFLFVGFVSETMQMLYTLTWAAALGRSCASYASSG